MKLRLQSNSVRLRLKRSEVDHLALAGFLEETIILGTGMKDVFRFALKSSPDASHLTVHLEDQAIRIEVPAAAAQQWAASDEVGMEAHLPAGGQNLHVLIEKDFACLDRSDEENTDTFPNPLAGTKC